MTVVPSFYAKRSNRSLQSLLFHLWHRSTVIESIPLIFKKDRPWANQIDLSITKKSIESIEKPMLKFPTSDFATYFCNNNTNRHCLFQRWARDNCFNIASDNDHWTTLQWHAKQISPLGVKMNFRYKIRGDIGHSFFVWS